ncbi:Zn(2)-C6 fungal-type DNA-binding domain protein [Pyrenophora tritici-repentis]|nr:Zn(2)-C6 fungal-type DNA-binding domain protein [Pyrenophora tritici-repentis]KAF7455247.1 Zn-C6 fungal-type DNA-binding domain protein [Pyrenophora tritici-repentis]KAI1531373.1 C6 transcription factor [Pyrenophora tritici-repentis]KAI1533307.1 C6 transcription factor [Pyrenophora tritici-repentis]KAI1565862.1 C6 transcription factor [Pyrenophora tritici-repentis]
MSKRSQQPSSPERVADYGLEQVFALLRSQPFHVAQQILIHIRRGTDIHSILRYVEYGSLRLQLMLVPDTTFQFTSPYLADMMPLFQGTDNPYLSSRLYQALSAEASQQGTEAVEHAIYRVPYPGARIYDPRISPELLKPSKWTSVSSDHVFLTRLLEAYLLYEYPLWPCFHKDHFLGDMTSGRTDYCSPLLVNAILTAACHGMGTLQDRAEFWNPKTHSYLCMAETRRLWKQEQEQGVLSLPSVQAATILGRVYFANGMDSMGWSTWTDAVAIANKLDLYDIKPHFSEKERVSRTITAWGIFSQQSFSCFYLMKPPLSRFPPQDGLPNYEHAQDFFGEIWVKYPLVEHLIPIHLGQTFLALIRLRCIMNDVASKALPEEDGQDEIDLQQASRYNSMLMQWFRELPEPLQPRNIAMPSHLLLHMQFHNLITMTFQPFLKHEKSFNVFKKIDAFQNQAGFSPTKLFNTSKASLQTLLHMFYHRHGFDAYYIFLLQVLVQLGFDAVERLRTPEAQQEHFPAVMKATRATLILCAKGLRDQGRNFYLSELIFRILRDEMNPVDVKLLRDWARVKNEEEREELMMEHIQSDYPVNVEAITCDPTERRLNRLLKSMGELKLPGDGGPSSSTQHVQQASRTWRTIVF